jgi:hypothetical protein
MANREYAVFTKSKCEHVQQVVTYIQTPQERSEHILFILDSSSSSLHCGRGTDVSLGDQLVNIQFHTDIDLAC